MPSTATTLAGPPLAPYAEDTLNRLLITAVERFGDQPALGIAGQPDRVSYRQLESRVASAAALLESHGVRAGDRVAILSTNSPEWVVADYAALSLGAITVPVYPTLTAPQVAEILHDCDARVVFVSGSDQVAKVPPGPAVIELTRLAHAGAPGAAPAAWRERALAVSPDDLATLIYTSGTTGTPKGVMLSHGNLAAMVAATRQHGSLRVEPGEVALSILPLSHVFERAADYYFLGSGVTIVYAESMQTVVRDVGVERPHHVIAVPRLFEKIHAAFVSAPGLKGRLARWAADTACEWEQASAVRRRLADRLVFEVLRAKLGGRMRTFICGGAPLDPRVGALFHAAGVPVYEGYGLTETSPVISANRPGALRLGSAGVPYPGVELRLGNEQEVQVRAPGVTRGYWQRPAETAEAFTADGWFRTGDVGEIRDGFLFIVDRLKDLIVTAGGKNVAPQPIELRVASSPHVAQAVLIGDRRPYLVMLVAPEGNPAPALLLDEVTARLTGLARVERPKRLAIVEGGFTTENGFLTPTLKVRRRAVQQAHASLLDEMYAGRAGVAIPEDPATAR
jgi:long-chain acyl-CoA synthetase